MLDFFRKFFQADATGSTNPNDVCTLVTGGKGTGKTYARVRYFAEVFLPQTNRVLITNFELDIEAISQFVARKTKGTPHEKNAESIKKRIIYLPREITRRWRFSSLDGPWNLHKDHGIDTYGCHIEIDEIHNFCGSKDKPAHVQQWLSWMGELRKDHITCTFITQAEGKLSKNIKDEVSVTWSLEDKGRMRDDFFGFLYGDLWQLSAKMNGFYEPVVQEWEVTDFGKKNKQKPRVIEWVRRAEIFPLYNSYSKPIGETSASRNVIVFCPGKFVQPCMDLGVVKAGSLDLVAEIEQGYKDFTAALCHPSSESVIAPILDLLGDKLRPVYETDEEFLSSVAMATGNAPPPKMEWELRSWPSLLFWFIRRNLWGIFRKVAPVSALVLFLALGGVGWIMRDGVRYVSGIATKSHVSIPASAGTNPGPGGGPGAKPGPHGPGSSPAPSPETQLALDALAAERSATAAAQAERDAERKRAEDLKAALARQSALVAVSPSFIILQGGYSYALQEKIDSGFFAGRSVVSIDPVRRCAVLDDGSVLRLGQPVIVGPSVRAPGQAERAGPVEAENLRTAPGSSVRPVRPVGKGSAPVRPVGASDADIKPGAPAR